MSDIIKAIRYHDISAGHRVVGQGGACESLHGHNYRVTFHLEASGLDEIGMVIDFGVIKSTLCVWLEDNWDHKFLVWNDDPWIEALREVDADSIVEVDFNPTAENMGQYLLNVVAPDLLQQHSGVRLSKVEISETRKCSVSVEL